MTDAVFSMDGDVAPSTTRSPTSASAMAPRFSSMMRTVTASWGLWDAARWPISGSKGRVQVETGSLGKAFGVMGGLAPAAGAIDRVRVGARSFILTASLLAPSLAAAAAEALRMISSDDSRVVRLWENRAFFARKMEQPRI